MPDYVAEADVEEFVTSVVQKTLDGIAGARTANQLVLNPKMIVLDFIVLKTGGENQVSTEQETTPPEQTESTTDTPATRTINDTSTSGSRTDDSTTTPPSRSTITGRAGGDATDTERHYEEFED